jgi:hypothetical protein
MKRKTLDEKADEYGARQMDVPLNAERKHWSRRAVAAYVGCAASNGYLAGYRAAKRKP